MTDTCTISRAGAGDPTYDPATDSYTYPTADEIYVGKCRVKPADTVDLAEEAGETVVGARRYVVSVPTSTTTVQRNDVLEVTASVLDSGLVGTKFRVLGALKGSQVTARRLACEETSA